ncbi:MAG: YIP1 family protein [Candidatus Sericytochromatia bacterium]
MQALLDTVFTTLFQPGPALQARIHRRHWWQAATLVWLVSSLLTFSAAARLTPAQMGLALLCGWLAMLMLWWLASLMLHFTSDLFGGQGRFADCMTGIGLALTPLMLAAPVNALPNLLGDAGHTLAMLAWMGLLFWVVALLARNLSTAESFSLDRSLGALILSGIFVAALMFASGLLGLLEIFLWGAMLQA